MPEGNQVLHVYIIHWNAPEWCHSAVRSILKSQGVIPQITIINNGGDLNLPESVEVVNAPRNLGYAGGANLALDHWRRTTDSRFCVIGSHDLHVEPLTLASLVLAMEQQPVLGVAGPWLDPGPDPYDTTDWGTRIPPTSAARGPESNDLTPVYWASGTCLMLRRDCVSDVGAFDARLGSYVEDVDYCYRAQGAGWMVAVVTSASARGLGTAHRHQASRLVTGNRIYVHWKVFGLRPAVRELGWAIRVTLGACLGAVAPWRSQIERRSSRFYAGAYGLGTTRAIRLILQAYVLRPGRHEGSQ